MKTLVTIAKVALPLVLLGAGAFAMVALIQARPKAAKKPAEVIAPLVEVLEVAPTRADVVVEAMGVVGPARVMVLQPQVSGVVVEQHPRLVEGGFVTAGDELVRVDDRDYELMVEQTRAQVSAAKLQVRLEEGRSKVAQREWAAMEDALSAGAAGAGAAPESDRELALRDPQIKAAKAALSAAQSAVKAARLSLQRTRIEAPWSGYVSMENVEIGQLVGPASQLARLVGTDEVWVEVAVPVERLQRIAIPGTNATEGAAVTVVHEPGVDGARIERHGTVLRLLPELSPQGRMARLLIAVQDPFDLAAEPAQRGLPLLLGAFVHVRIDGRPLDDAVPVPREALRDGDNVWLVDAEGKLSVQPVEVAWRERDRVLVARGLSRGDRIVTSPLATPVPGMDVRVVGPTTAAKEPAPPVEPERGER